MAASRRSETGSNDLGFTLTELLVVLAVIGLLIVATPTLIQAALPGARAAAEARALASNLRAMRAFAIAHGTQTRVVFEPYGRAFTDEPGHATHTLPGGVRLGFESQGAAHAIVFYPDGSSSGGQVFVGNERSRHRVATDWLTGRVSVDE